jgi:hypothetical protein
MSYQALIRQIDGLAISGIHIVALSKCIQMRHFHDQNMYTRKVQMENVSLGKQSIGILRAQPGIKGWNLAYVILRQEHII